MAGCSGVGGTSPVDQHSGGHQPDSNTQTNTTKEPPSTPDTPGGSTASPVDLTSRPVSASSTVEPKFRWHLPQKGTRYRPLPSGILLVWADPTAGGSDAVPFSVSALKTDGQTLWTYKLERPAGDVRFVDVSPSGGRVAFLESDGNVHVLSALDGKVVAKVHVELENPNSDSVYLIADGQSLAVKSRTQSGVVPWTLAVYPIATGAKVAYGTEGMEVHSSPYHGMVLGLQAVDQQGVRVTTAAGDVGLIPYEYEAQAEQVKMASSADGQLIYVVSRKKGLDVFGRDLTKRFHVEASPTLDVELAPVSKVLWYDASPGVVRMVDADGKTKTFTIDKDKITSGRVMPGGEKIFQTRTAGQKADCVVKTNGEVVGCYPFVGFGTTAPNGHTFFWTQLQDGTIAAFSLEG